MDQIVSQIYFPCNCNPMSTHQSLLDRMRSHDTARTLSWSRDWTLKSNRVHRFGGHVVVRATRLQRRARADIRWCFTKATSFCICLSQPESKIYLLSQNNLVLENRRSVSSGTWPHEMTRFGWRTTSLKLVDFYDATGSILCQSYKINSPKYDIVNNPTA